MLEQNEKLDVNRRPEIGAWSVAPLPPATVARRRRLIRIVALLSVLGGLGMSAIPGPKRGLPQITTRSERGTITQIHRFSYSQTYGVPFPVVRVEFSEEGRGIRNLSVKGTPIFGNMAVALALIIGAVAVMGIMRRR